MNTQKETEEEERKVVVMEGRMKKRYSKTESLTYDN